MKKLVWVCEQSKGNSVCVCIRGKKTIKIVPNHATIHRIDRIIGVSSWKSTGTQGGGMKAYLNKEKIGLDHRKVGGMSW